MVNLEYEISHHEYFEVEVINSKNVSIKAEELHC